MKKLIDITQNETDTIQVLFERLNSLNSMSGTLADSTLNIDEQNWFYKKLIDDSIQARIEFNNWWTDICKKYNLDSTYTEQYSVDFDNRCIFTNIDKCTSCGNMCKE